MRYVLNENILGIEFVSRLMPYRKTVNNTYTIESQDYRLLGLLNKKEHDRNSEVIDWFLFKPDKTILIDDFYNIYGCVEKTDGYVKLAKINFRFINKTKDYKILVDSLTVKQLWFIEQGLRLYAIGELVLNKNEDESGNINFEDIEVKSKTGTDSPYAVVVKWYEDFEDTGYLIDVVREIVGKEE